ncbi:glycosyltransferase [Parasphaerochaeta coccoides]|uniref:Glycosyl transferase group 1 n=1 Tax=Parasphaerochaeta coccoides (strain ATCC BAA-1237 / DSM 17374 / SPN1) TaxID=760011 RepID=F4GH59_PARC1|nr:glycosyltransferase [Parasphaerochaeta coccoides]AEC01534.1 glycosyl transferase group 1 [Parasphaerochaeta coccoides DSM 17374]
MDTPLYTVGQFCEAYPPVMDGVANVLMNYVSNLRKMNVDARSIVSGSEADVESDRDAGDFHVLRARLYPLPGMKPYGAVSYPRRFRKALDDINFDIVHAHEPAFLGRLAYKIARKRNIPFVITFHTQIKDDIKSVVKSTWMTEKILSMGMKIYDKADEVWVPSKEALDVIRSYGYQGPATIMMNCTDFVPPDDTLYASMRDTGRKAYMKDSSLPLLVYLGQQSVKKNIPFFLDALASIARDGDEFEMLMVGEGPDKKSFETYVEAHGLGKKVHFLGRITDREKVKTVLASSDVMIFPSLYDVASIAIREAAAYRLPVIGIEGSCTSSIIENGKNGYLSANDRQAFISLLRHAIREPEERARLGLSARDTIYHSWAEVVGVVDERYRSLINGYRSRQGKAPLV